MRMVSLLQEQWRDYLESAWAHAVMDVAVTALSHEPFGEETPEEEAVRDDRMLDMSQRMQRTREKKSFYADRVTRLNGVRKASRERENDWVQEALSRLAELAGRWIAEAEKERLKKELDLQRRGSEEKLRKAREEVAAARLVAKEQAIQIRRLRASMKASQKMFEKEVEARSRSAECTIKHLKVQAAMQKAEFEEQIRAKEKEQEEMAQIHAKQVAELEAELDEMTETAKRRFQWLESLKIELEKAQNTITALETEHKEAHKKWESERDDLVKTLKFHMEQSNRRLQHIESLKNEVAISKRATKEAERKLLKERRAHTVERKSLRWEIWKRDETARSGCLLACLHLLCD